MRVSCLPAWRRCASWPRGRASAADSPTPKAKRPTVAVTDFDYGTVIPLVGRLRHRQGHGRPGHGRSSRTTARSASIERKKLDTILAEQDFAHSDRADPSAAKLSKIGKVLGVKYIITGSITKFGGEEKKQGGGIWAAIGGWASEGQDRGHGDRAHGGHHDG